MQGKWFEQLKDDRFMKSSIMLQEQHGTEKKNKYKTARCWCLDMEQIVASWCNG